MTHYVELVEIATDTVVQRFGPFDSRRSAERHAATLTVAPGHRVRIVKGP